MIETPPINPPNIRKVAKKTRLNERAMLSLTWYKPIRYTTDICLVPKTATAVRISIMRLVRLMMNAAVVIEMVVILSVLIKKKQIVKNMQ